MAKVIFMMVRGQLKYKPVKLSMITPLCKVSTPSHKHEHSQEGKVLFKIFIQSLVNYAW